MGRQAKAHRGDQTATRSGVRRDGSSGKGRRRDRGSVFSKKDTSSGKSKRGSSDVGVPDLLHKGRIHSGRQRRSQHSPRYTAVRSAHSQRALRLRKSRGSNHANSQKGSADLRKRARGDRANASQDWIEGYSRQEPRLQVQSSRSRLAPVFLLLKLCLILFFFFSQCLPILG